MRFRVGLLWHLHQPDYRDPFTGRPQMPWARLHALRGYRDLLVESVAFNVPMTINVVPSLWDQLLYYAEGGDDRHLELTRMPAESLTPELAGEVVAALPGGHPAMVKAWPGYAQLRRRLSMGPPYATQDLRDLQVWATLAWFGATAHQDFPALRRLALRERGFSEADKAELLEVHDAIVAEVPRLLHRLVQASGPALCTSPYYHPILPILVDARHAKRAMPDLPDEVSFAWPEDARRQLVLARERVAALSGAPPQGLWPSEGSVSPEVVALAAEAGFRWLVTDRGVLARSERERIAGAPQEGGWDLGMGMIGFFRDTELSDRIGFRYALWNPAEAVQDLVRSLQHADGVATIALDGENPWETYHDAGGAFRRHLYRALAEGPVRAITFDEAAAEPVVGRVTGLHTGSWIGADFRIWIGHPADREAWRAIAEVRNVAEAAAPERREAAMHHILAAEGSDWMWWYGDDFHTEWEGMFDTLFRSHLRAAWEALGLTSPPALERPIGGAGAPAGGPPQHALVMSWDNAGAWRRWQGAGRLRAFGGSMAAGSAVVEVRYGWSVAESTIEALWLRIETRGSGWRVATPTHAEARVVGGALVVRVNGGEAVDIQLVDDAGAQWPNEPLTLVPPVQPLLAWWEV